MDTSISLYEEVWAVCRLEQGKTLADFGIHPLASWTLVATCSWHGRQTLELCESTEEPDEHEYITCLGCAMRTPTITRWLPVLARERR